MKEFNCPNRIVCFHALGPFRSSLPPSNICYHLGHCREGWFAYMISMNCTIASTDHQDNRNILASSWLVIAHI